jgi:membrane associated rhomboid family serine protease
MFCLILAQGGNRLARISRVMFSLLTAFLLLLALAYFSGSVSMRHSAALVGFACSLPGLACGIRQGWRECLRLVAPGRVQTQAQRVR